MHVRFKRFVCTLAAALALHAAAAAPSTAQDAGLALGAVPAPVVIADLEGAPVDLAQFIGKKPVLLEFWATWCPVCEELAPKLDAAATKYAGKAEILVIAVGVGQNARTIKRHVEKHKMPGRVLYDAKGAATRAFMAPTTSYIVALDARGRVVYTGTGGTQNIDAALAKATAPVKSAK